MLNTKKINDPLLHKHLPLSSSHPSQNGIPLTSMAGSDSARSGGGSEMNLNGGGLGNLSAGALRAGFGFGRPRAGSGPSGISETHLLKTFDTDHHIIVNDDDDDED